MSQSEAAFNPSNLVSPKAILRYIEILFAIVTFACIVDRDMNLWQGSFSDTARAVVAFGVVAFVWALFMVVVYLLQRLCVTQIKIVNILETIIDAGLIVYGVIVSIVWSVKVSDLPNCGGWKACERTVDNARASVVFSWLTCVCLIISLVLDIMSVLKGGAQQAAEAAN